MTGGDLILKLRLLATDEGAASRLSKLSSSISGLRREFGALGESSRASAAQMRAGMESVSASIARLRAAALSIAAVFGGVGITSGIARTAADFESLEASMRAVFGSSQAASEEMARLRAESERLGLPLETLAKSWMSFAAATRGTVLEGQQAREVFTALTEAATVFGLSQYQLEGALLAVQQMISKGTVSSEELRQQLGERLYGAVQIAARSIGIATSEFNQLLERGLIPVDRFLPAFATQLRRELGGGVADASNTARTAFTKLENALLELKLEFARSGFMDALVEAARNLSAAFRDPEFRQSVREFGQIVGAVIRLVVQHADKLAILGGAIAGAKAGASIGRIGGPGWAVAGAGIGALIGGAGIATILPSGTASGQDKKQVMDVEAAVSRLKRRIEETQRAARIGLIRPDEAKARIAADEQTIARLTAKVNMQAPDTPSDLGRDLMRKRWDDYIKQYRDKTEQLRDALAELRKMANAAGISETSAEFRRAEAAVRAKFAGGSRSVSRQKTATSLEVETRLSVMREQADAELAILKDGLERAKAAYDAALEDRLISIRDYYAAKTAIEQREIDAEIARTQRLLDEQRRLQSDPRASEADRIRAKGEVAKLEADLITLNNRRADVEQRNARAAANAERELAQALEDARLKLAQITGTETDADRRAAIERSYADLKTRLKAEGQDTSIIDRLIDVEAADRNLQALEARWRLALENMRNAEQSAKIESDSGLITVSQAQERIAQAHQEATRAMEELLPKMEAAANSIGNPEQIARIQAWKNELASIKTVVDPIAQAIDTDVKNAFTSMFEAIGSGAKSAGDAFRDFARAVVASLQRIAVQKLAERLFSGLSFSNFFAGLFKGFATGGLVTGGVPRRDSVPALLMPGEYVIRREAVARFGLAFFDAINGLRRLPSVVSGRLAFAAGGPVPAVSASQPVNQAVRIVNVIDPAMARDWIESPSGERVVLNILSRNAATVRTILGA